MRKEVENWWRQANSDLEKAKVLFKSGNFDGTAFFCQQAAEKSLKALVIVKTKEKKIESHSLVYLGKEANVFIFPWTEETEPAVFYFQIP
ncbi:HEPN domain-containing protein [Candidatus Woesearchaeota archaeon]|nr:HEPN domain-containing protein [Candidatus Woesearchaeota archaeon]